MLMPVNGDGRRLYSDFRNEYTNKFICSQLNRSIENILLIYLQIVYIRTTTIQLLCL